jgi:hypothetical protein
MDSGLLVGLSTMRARPCHSLKNLRDSVLELQSLYGTTQTYSGQISRQAVHNGSRRYRSRPGEY